MRILMLSWEYEPYIVGGLGKHVVELLPALDQQDVEVHLVTPRLGGGEACERVGKHGVVHRVDVSTVDPSDIYTSAWHVNVHLSEFVQSLWTQVGGFDLIHAHDWLVQFSATALKHVHRTPLVATLHATERGRNQGAVGSPLSHAIHRAEWRLTYEAWRVITCSTYMAAEVTEFFNAPADKIDVIPNGVDTTPYERVRKAKLASFRMLYALPDEKIVFNVGRVVHEKGVQVLVEAAPRVLAGFPQAKFVVAGRGGSLDAFRNRAWELGVGEKVLFAGFISDEERTRLFCLADCAVFPSLYEPFGIVALEAMAARCPVVVTEVGGLREVVQHGETGITVYSNNPDSLAWGILHTLQHPEWSAARAENAYKVVKEDFNWDRIAVLTTEVYAQVVQEHAHVEW